MTTDDLTKRIAKAVEQVTCSRWEDTDDCGYCESNMVTFRHLSYMYCDAHDTITKPGDRCPHAAEVAAAVLPIITTEVRAAKAEAWDEGYMEATSGDDDPLANPSRYETGDQA